MSHHPRTAGPVAAGMLAIILAAVGTPGGAAEQPAAPTSAWRPRDNQELKQWSKEDAARILAKVWAPKEAMPRIGPFAIEVVNQPPAPAKPEAAAKPVAFDTHDGYFVSNKFDPDAATSFVVIKDQKAFDEVFGVAFVMNDKSHRLPPDAFKTKMVVGAIHRGKAFWRYKVERVEAEGKTLIVRYSTQSTPSDTAEFACPLILSLDKGDYTAVQFVEDGKAVKKVEAGEGTTKPAGGLTSFKGWELYVWQEKGETFYSLLVGTNRIKSGKEITDAAVKGIESIQPKLDQLKVGESVFIMGRDRTSSPPDDVARAVEDYCKKIGLKAGR